MYLGSDLEETGSFSFSAKYFLHDLTLRDIIRCVAHGLVVLMQLQVHQWSKLNCERPSEMWMHCIISGGATPHLEMGQAADYSDILSQLNKPHHAEVTGEQGVCILPQ